MNRFNNSWQVTIVAYALLDKNDGYHILLRDIFIMDSKIYIIQIHLILIGEWRRYKFFKTSHPHHLYTSLFSK